MNNDELRAACLQRFEGKDYTPDGPPAYAYHVHHDLLIEQLRKPVECRIDWSLTNKPRAEIPVRLDRLRPVVAMLPQDVLNTLAEVDRLWAEADLLWTRANRLNGETQQLRIEAYRLLDEANRLDAEGDRLLKTLASHPAVIAAHALECPGCPWDGNQLVFP